MTIIEKMDGSRYDLTKYGLPLLKVNPVDVQYDSENVKGRPGRNRTTRYHGVRKLQLQMFLQARDEADTIFVRDQLAEIFDDCEDFYVYEQVSRPYEFEAPGQSSFKSAKDQLQYTPYLFKRWRVERINNDGIEWDGTKGKRVLEFETSDLPYGATPFTSVELAASEKEWGNDFLAWGLELNWVEGLPSYTFSANEFDVLNLGNVAINPRYMPLKFTVRGTFANYVQIENLTTGDVFRYDGPLASTDTLVLDGVNQTKNGQSIVRHTNKKLLTLNKKVNQFRVTGGNVSHFEVECPFYFL